MTSINDGSELSKTPSRLTSAFSIAPRSAVSSKPVVRTKSPWKDYGQSISFILDRFRSPNQYSGPLKALLQNQSSTSDSKKWNNDETVQWDVGTQCVDLIIGAYGGVDYVLRIVASALLLRRLQLIIIRLGTHH